MLTKLLIPFALAVAVLVAAITVQPPQAPAAKPTPTRWLQLHR
jgi:hypothetical protein